MSRDLIEIAVFEHVQAANWGDDGPSISAHDICDLIAPVRSALLTRAQNGGFALDRASITDIHHQLAQAIGISPAPEFKKPAAWQEFLDGIAEASSPDPITVADFGAWIVAQLFWNHFRHIRLLTGWVVIECLAMGDNQPLPPPPPGMLSRVLGDMSSAGPPLYDAEDFRAFVGTDLIHRAQRAGGGHG